MSVTVIPIVVSALGTILKGLEKKLGELEIRGRIETDNNTISVGTLRRIPRDLMRLTVTQTPLKNLQFKQ